MPYNTVRLLRRRRLYSNFLQFSDNFGLAALVRPSGKRARLGSMEASAVGATQDGALLCGHVSYSFNTGIYKLLSAYKASRIKLHQENIMPRRRVDR